MSSPSVQSNTRVFAGVNLIDTPLVTAALDFAREHNDQMSYNHVYRSWIFGAIVASKLPHFADVDLEVHAVAAILHDLAWDHTSKFSTSDKRFEVDSANAARQFLEQKAPQYDPCRRQLVWDSIALHTTASIAQHKENEVALCNMGIFADFAGAHFPGGLITKDEYNAVLRELPSLDFKESVKELMCGLCRHKPSTTYDNFVKDFGHRFVDGYKSDSANAVDMLLMPIEQ